MRRQYFAILITFLAIFSFCSCSKNNTEEIIEPVILKGKVQLYDDGTQVKNNFGMQVRIENSNPAIESIIQADGSFNIELNQIVPGQYTLVFMKPGHGVFKRNFSIKNPLGKQSVIELSAENLGSLSPVEILSARSSVSVDNVILDFNINGLTAQQNGYIRFFHRKDSPGVTWDATSKKISVTYQVKAGLNSIEIPKDYFYQCGYKSGDVVYLKAYGDAYYPSIWTENVSGKTIFPNINLQTPQEISFIVP